MTAPSDTARRYDASSPKSVLVFERAGRAFCCPFAEVDEILESPTLMEAAAAAPPVAGVVLHRDLFIPAMDPACVVDLPPSRSGVAILLAGHGRRIAVLADAIIGFRTAVSIVPAPWVPPGRVVRAAAALDRIGQALVIAADGLDDIPSAPVEPVNLAPASPGDAKSSPAGPDMHLIYTVGERRCATAYGQVLRILYHQPFFRIPAGRAPTRYVVEVNGAIVPVLELPAAAGVLAASEGADAPTEAEAVGNLVVLTSPAGPLALRVDGIERPAPREPDVTEGEWFAAPGVAGVGRFNDQPHALVTGAALLRDLARWEGV